MNADELNFLLEKALQSENQALMKLAALIKAEPLDRGAIQATKDELEKIQRTRNALIAALQKSLSS